MKSKEAVLELICEAKSVNCNDGRIYFLRETINKDLELLNIIKFLIKKGDIVVNSDLFVDYPELYEWLEQNEWNIIKSN